MTAIRLSEAARAALTLVLVVGLIAISGADVLADTLHVTDDAYTQEGDPDKNKGSSSKVKLKEDTGIAVRRRRHHQGNPPDVV